MKKLKMLIFTAAIVLLTFISYVYENFNVNVPTYKQPSINMNSSKFGEIKEITWLENYSRNILLILSIKNNGSSNISCLYYLNVDNGKSQLIHSFPSHKNLNDVILFDDPFSSNDIITAYNSGIVKTKINIDDLNNLSFQYEPIEIDGFNDANSMDFKGDLFFTKENDKLIYIKKQFNSGFFSFSTNENTSPDIIKHYRKPYYIVGYNSIDSVLTYTSVKKDGLHLYSMNYNGTPLSKLNKPIIKNVVTAKNIRSFSDGYFGMNMHDNSNGEVLNVFMKRRNTNGKGNLMKLDTIPFNLDKFGAIPSIDAVTYNDDYSLVYTCYDKEGKGQIRIKNYMSDPKVIVEEKNLFGPIKVSIISHENNYTKLILYFTYENNKVKAKICDTQGNLVKDITNLIE